MSAAPTVQPLHGNQIMAVEPADTVWLSASAGTGKTHVLSSRVLRLLLQPVVLRLLGPRAWWMPGWLDRLLPEVRLSHDMPEAVSAPIRIRA